MVSSKRESLVCSCRNDIFISMGDDFGFTLVECTECSYRNSIMDSSLIAKKLLSPYGEDYCKIFGVVLSIGSFLEDSIVIVDYTYRI